MAVSGRVIRNRIKSVKNTKKITKAMELVSAAKMRRATASAVQSRSYAGYAWELLLRLRAQAPVDHPLFAQRPVKKLLLVVISSNRGLAGGFNANVGKKLAQQLKNLPQLLRSRVGDKTVESSVTDVEIEYITVGKRAESSVRKQGGKIVASFIDISDTPKFAEAQPLVNMVVQSFAKQEYDKVAIVYTHFVSPLLQTAKIRQVLPVSEVDLEKTLGADASMPADHKNFEEKFLLLEPSAEKIITTAVTRLIESQVFETVLESAASEHSARMMAMRSASDAATDMIDSLTLVFNQARQASITKEISEISAGKAALE